MQRDCLNQSLQLRFQKPIKYFSLLLIPFLLLLSSSWSLLSLLLSIIYYIIYLILFSLLYEIYHLLSCNIILLVFHLSFVAFIYSLFLSSFLFHFSSFIYFFAIFFLLYFKWVHHVLHLHVISFLVLSLLTHNPTSLWLILREERQDHTNCREYSSPFCLCCCVIWGGGGGGAGGLGLVNLLFFYPPSDPYYFMGHPTPKPTTFPGSSPNSSPKETLGTSLPEASRGCWRRSLNRLHHHHQRYPSPVTSSLLYRRRG